MVLHIHCTSQLLRVSHGIQLSVSVLVSLLVNLLVVRVNLSLLHADQRFRFHSREYASITLGNVMRNEDDVGGRARVT